jgi:rSAM/selenodomain-associated transferase 1
VTPDGTDRDVTPQVHLIVLAKEPLPGRSKTRLSPALTPDDAARVARAALLDTLAAVAATPAAHRTVVLDGSPAGWLPAGFDVVQQVAGSLNDRLDAAFRTAFARHPLPMLLIGMDTPQVTPPLLVAAIDALLGTENDAVLGHATDGGWWALGLRHPHDHVFDGVPMSTDLAGAAQQLSLDLLGLRTAVLPELRDIDHVEDLVDVATLMSPASRLAALVPTLGLAA